VTNLQAFIGVALMSACVAAWGEFRGTADPRGALLYSTYCVGCHTTQVHWREKKLATDWTSLKQQVRRWQSNAGLGLSEDDVADIARYLNDLHYHFALPIQSSPVKPTHRAMAQGQG
jgi:mono/diheme cytochrome c family protein